MPNLDLRSLAFSATLGGSYTATGDTKYNYNGPSIAVRRTVGASILQGGILPIDAPASNSSWSMSFNGPQLSCEVSDDHEKRELETMIANSTLTSSGCYEPPVFFSQRGSEFFEEKQNTTPSLWIAMLPSLLQPSPKAPWTPAACEHVTALPDTGNWTSPLVPTGPDANTVMQCFLEESKYDLSFQYVNGSQSVLHRLTPTNRSLTNIEAFLNTDIINNDFLSNLAYQSVFNAFAEWITGSVLNGLWNQVPFIVNSSIMSTSLLETDELSYLRPEAVDSTLASVYYTSFQQVVADSGSPAFRGLSARKSQNASQRLAAMLEDIFMNATISLMSSAELQ